MRIDDITIEVRDGDLKRVAVVPAGHAEFRAQGVRNGVGTWSLTLPAEDALVGALSAPGAGILVTGVGPVPFSGPVLARVEVDSADDPAGAVTFEGVTDDVVLADRLAFPQPSNADASAQAVAEDVRTGPAESVIHGFVNANAGPGAPVARREPRLVMGTNLARGATVTRSARFDMLGELIGGIADAAGLNFRVVNRGSQLVFETDEVRDVSAFVRLSVEGNTLASHTTEIVAPGVTRAIVAGKGEGTERVVRQYVSSAAEESRWRRVIERFVDAGATEELEELAADADELFAREGFTGVNVSVVPMDDTTMVFGEDWRLGDKVTVVTNGVESTSTVSGWVLSADRAGVRLGAVLGDLSSSSPAAEVSARIDDAFSRISLLERRHEVPTGGTPTGAMVAFLGATAPPGWLLCQGQAVSRTQYAALFAVMGTTYGAGNGSTTFNLPDMRKRVPVGYDSSDVDFNALGKTGGAKTHTLSTNEMPSHNHGGATGAWSGTTGSGGAHSHTLNNPTAASSGHTHNISTNAWVQAYVTAAGNLQARVLTGKSSWNATHRLNATLHSSSSDNNTSGLGVAGRTEGPSSSVTSSVASGGAHTHSVPSHTHSVSAQGGGAAHNNMQPYIVVNQIVKT